MTCFTYRMIYTYTCAAFGLLHFFPGLWGILPLRSDWSLSCVTTDLIMRIAGRPGGVSGYPRAWCVGQFREFESPRVHTRINSWGLFLAHKLTCGKRESVC